MNAHARGAQVLFSKEGQSLREDDGRAALLPAASGGNAIACFRLRQSSRAHEEIYPDAACISSDTARPLRHYGGQGRTRTPWSTHHGAMIGVQRLHHHRHAMMLSTAAAASRNGSRRTYNKKRSDEGQARHKCNDDCQQSSHLVRENTLYAA